MPGWLPHRLRTALQGQQSSPNQQEEPKPMPKRPEGFLVWFSIQTAEQAVVVLPIICKCTEECRNEKHIQVLLTLPEAVHRHIITALPQQVTTQYVPTALGDHFLDHWQPNVAIFMDAELQPDVVRACHERGAWLAWLNVQMSAPQFSMHSASQDSRQHMKELLYMFDLIMPEADHDVGRLLVLGAELTQMPAWYVDLSYARALESYALLARLPANSTLQLFQQEVACRPVWLIANTTPEEWRDYLDDVCKSLRDRMSSLLTVIALTDLSKSKEVQHSLTQGGQCALRWSQLRETWCPSMSWAKFLVIDEEGVLLHIYRAVELVFAGSSLHPDDRGSDLSEACAAGCAVVTGSNSRMYIHAADVNQAALRSEQVESPLSQQGLSQQDGAEQSEGQRCQNPTPRRAAGPPEDDCAATSNRSLARIRTVPEDEVQEWQDCGPTSSGQSNQGGLIQSMTAPASTSRNWRFSPFNSPTGDSEAVPSARSLDNGWRRSVSLSENNVSGPERAARVSNSRVPLSVALRRTSSLVSGGDDMSPSRLADDRSVFTARWPTLQRHEGQSRMPSWQLPQESKGPAVWQVEDQKELAEVVGLLLSEPLHRRSQGHAAVQGAAKIADSMMTIAWEVLVIMVLDPAMTGLKTNSIVHGPPLSPADTVREQETVDAASSQTSVVSLDEES